MAKYADDEIWQALRVAQAADFVAEMPGRLGPNLPGAQSVRRPGSASPARALVKEPDIYIFDDSFSALVSRLMPHTAALEDEIIHVIVHRCSS